MDSSFVAGQQLLRGNYSQYTVTGKGYFVRAGAYSKVPHAGDIIYFYSKEKGRVAHVGIVEDVKKIGDTYIIHTIEGNTSALAFERNGGGVARKEYRFKSSEVGGTNRINGFGTPLFVMGTCTPEELIEVARKEIGYLEKASNAKLEEKTANAGMSNYTKYGEWYSSNGTYWCQQFVSWCAYMACKLHNESRKTGWESIDEWDVYRLNGTLVKDKWLEIEGRWYVFDGSGHMIKGWFKQGYDWYYINPLDGAMLSGQWVKVDGLYFYLTQSGVLARSTYIKDADKDLYYWVDADGKYQKEYDTSKPDLKNYDLAE